MADYNTWKNGINGLVLNVDGAFGAQCVDEALSWGQALFPGVHWSVVFPPVPAARQMYDTYNPAYWTRVENNHNDPNQVPPQGAVAIFAGSPEAGYTSTFQNPEGHVGVVDHTDAQYIWMMQQDAGLSGGASLLRPRPWRYTRLIGWLVPKVGTQPTPIPAPTNDPRIGKTLYLHPVPKWRVYRVGAPPNGVNSIGYLLPANYNHGPGGKPGLSYPIVGVSKYPNTVTIQTDAYGLVDIFTDSDAEII